MTPDELAHKCVLAGFITDRMELQAINAFATAYDRKGQFAVESKIERRMKGSPIRSAFVLNEILNEIPDKATDAEPDLDIALSVQDEIEVEKRDMEGCREIIRMQNELDGGEPRGFLRPNSPSFDRSPSIFDAEPYRSLTADKQALYKENTFISVLEDAKRAKTSMHEICRRKGLVYEALLF